MNLTGKLEEIFIECLHKSLQLVGYTYQNTGFVTTVQVSYWKIVFENSSVNQNLEFHVVGKENPGDSLDDSGVRINVFLSKKIGFMDVIFLLENYHNLKLNMDSDLFEAKELHSAIKTMLKEIERTIENELRPYLLGHKWIDHCYPDWR